MANAATGYYSQKPPLGPQVDWGHPLSRGLVGDWMFSEGAGSKINSRARAADVATTVAAPAWASGQYGPALTLNGSTQYATASRPPLITDGSGKFTVAAAYKTSSAGTFQTIYGEGNNGSTAQFFTMNINSGGLEIFMRNDTGAGPRATEAASSADGLWHVGLGTSDGATISVYRDTGGATKATAAVTSGATTLNTVTIGALTRTSTINPTNGQIAFVRTWNRFFPQADVQTFFEAVFGHIRPTRSYFFMSAAARLFGGIYTGGNLSYAGILHGGRMR